MLQRLIDDIKDSIAISIRQTSLVATMAFALFIALAFLCAAGFVYVLQTYGPIQACLAGAGVFFVVTLIMAAVYKSRQNRMKARVKRVAREGGGREAKSALHSAFADPMVVATGLQIVRAIGAKRLIPILAIGGLALGFLASRGGAPATDDSDEASEED
jgi:hypothetical protein